MPSYDPSTELLDLHGRVAIITGANSGIGLYILFHLARQGAKCYLAARSRAKFDAALKRLREEGMGEVRVWPVVEVDYEAGEDRQHLEGEPFRAQSTTHS